MSFQRHLDDRRFKSFISSQGSREGPSRDNVRVPTGWAVGGAYGLQGNFEAKVWIGCVGWSSQFMQ